MVSNTNEKHHTSSDEELVRRIIAGGESLESRSVASELIGRYQRSVYLWCFRYVREHEHALDLSQEVLLSAYQRLGSFEGRSKFSSWLFAITRNRCLNEVRRVSLLVDDEADPESVSVPAPTPDTDLENRESEERLMTLIEQTLDPIEQKAIWLRCFERMPVDDITIILGIDASSGARGLLQKARRKLRAALDTNEVGEQ